MGKIKLKTKTKPVALAGAAAAVSKYLFTNRFVDRFRKPKKQRRLVKAAKIGIPGLLALVVAGGAALKIVRGGPKKSRNFSLVGGGGAAPTNSQTRPAPAPPAAQPASEAKK